ncbi:hypothetical protein GQ457_01G032390 [Hibiscus cannabinus]
MARGRGNGGRGTVTLFVSNLPTKLHWSGLRQTFGRHGDLVDSFIANKLDRKGRRFGFVRFSNRKDADRAVERLNGFKLFGFRLFVSVARFNVRTSYWRKKREMSNIPLKRQNSKTSTQNPNKYPYVKEGIVCDQSARAVKNISAS